MTAGYFRLAKDSQASVLQSVDGGRGGGGGLEGALRGASLALLGLGGVGPPAFKQKACD